MEINNFRFVESYYELPNLVKFKTIKRQVIYYSTFNDKLIIIYNKETKTYRSLEYNGENVIADLNKYLKYYIQMKAYNDDVKYLNEKQ